MMNLFECNIEIKKKYCSAKIKPKTWFPEDSYSFLMNRLMSQCEELDVYLQRKVTSTGKLPAINFK